MSENSTPIDSTFSIENTIDNISIGNVDVLGDLFGNESSVKPEDVKPIIKEATPETFEVKKSSPKKQEAIIKDEEATENVNNQNLINSFLEDNPEGENKLETKEILKTSENYNDDSESIESSRFNALTKDLLKLGVFQEYEEFGEVNTPEEFLERFNSEKKKGATEIVNNFIGQFGQDYQDAFQAIFVNGADPKEYFGTYDKVVSFANLDLSQENNQEKIVKQALSDQGYELDDIETEIERLKNYGDLETVATKHHKVLIKKEAGKLAEIERKAEEQLQIKTVQRNQYINNVQTILQDKVKEKSFDGIPVNPKLASELQDYLLVDKWKTPAGETLSDFDKTILDLKRPENHNQKVKVALLLKLLEKDPTLSTIQKTGITNKSNELFSEITRQNSQIKKENGKASSWFL